MERTADGRVSFASSLGEDQSTMARRQEEWGRREGRKERRGKGETRIVYESRPEGTRGTCGWGRTENMAGSGRARFVGAMDGFGLPLVLTLALRPFFVH